MYADNRAKMTHYLLLRHSCQFIGCVTANGFRVHQKPTFHRSGRLECELINLWKSMLGRLFDPLPVKITELAALIPIEGFACLYSYQISWMKTPFLFRSSIDIPCQASGVWQQQICPWRESADVQWQHHPAQGQLAIKGKPVLPLEGNRPPFWGK